MELLNKKEAAELLGVSHLSMNRLMPEIGYVVVGKRRVMFDAQDLKKYVESRKVQPRKDRKASQP